MEKGSFINPYENLFSNDEENEKKEDKESSKKSRRIFVPKTPEKYKDEIYKNQKLEKPSSGDKKPEIFARKPFADSLDAVTEKPVDTTERDNPEELSKGEIQTINRQLLQNRSQEIADEVVNSSDASEGGLEAMAAANFIDSLSDVVANGEDINDALLDEISNQTIDELGIELTPEEIQVIEDLISAEVIGAGDAENDQDTSSGINQVVETDEQFEDENNEHIDEDANNLNNSFSNPVIFINSNNLNNPNSSLNPNGSPGASNANINGNGPAVPPIGVSAGGAGTPNIPNIGGTGGPNFGSSPPNGPNFNNFNSGSMHLNLPNFVTNPAWSVNRSFESRRNSHRGRDLLLGGIVGYLIGRRRGRINTEKKLLPIQKKIEKQVKELDQRIYIQEAKVRTLTAEKLARENQDARRLLAEKITAKYQHKTEVVTTEPETKIIKLPGEIAQVAVVSSLATNVRAEADNAAAEKIISTQTNERVEFASDNKTFEEANARQPLTRLAVLSMPTENLLKLASSIEIGGQSARQLYERGQINKDELREILAEQTVDRTRAEQLLAQKLSKELPVTDGKEILANQSVDPIAGLSKIGSDLKGQSSEMPTIYLDTDKDADISMIADEILNGHSTSNREARGSHNTWLFAGALFGFLIILAIFLF